jgi:hypothetical protein
MNVKKIVAAVGATVALGGAAVALTGGTADAARSIVANKTNPVIWGCINPSTNATVGGRLYVYDGSNTYPGCATWATKVYWSEKGNNGDTDALVPATAVAQTSVTNWAETSGWANDNMIRTVNLTRKGAADSDKCGGAPQCWLYTATLTDNGTFTTVAGKASPNSSSSATVAGDLTGTMIGGATVQIYASTNQTDGSLVPATQAGRGSFGTGDWVKQAFPAGTQFGDSTLTSYKWVYSLGCAGQTWTDAINPGDDGQGANDGNITAACPA